MTALTSLKIELELVDGVWIGSAPWLVGTVSGSTWMEVYYEVRSRYGKS